MQATFVKLEERHREALQQQARAEGCSMSDLIRRATIQFFNLPTDGPNGAAVEQERPDVPDVTPAPVSVQAVGSPAGASSRGGASAGLPSALNGAPPSSSQDEDVSNNDVAAQERE